MVSTLVRLQRRLRTSRDVPYSHVPITSSRHEQVRRGVVVQTKDPFRMALEDFVRDALYACTDQLWSKRTSLPLLTRSTSHMRTVVSSEADAR